MNNTQAPATENQSIGQLIESKNPTAPRITPFDIAENIVGEYYFTGQDGVIGNSEIAVLPGDHDQALSLLTFCVLVLRNGFTVTGESACASPENFDAEIGQRVARANAVQKVWPLMGYDLKCRLHEAARINAAHIALEG